jgi:methylglutaconyl-CoA hydratase
MPAMADSLHLKVTGDVATVTLTRPDAHNALDTILTGNLTQAFQKLGVAEAVRVIVLAAQGPSFCAGADVGWLTASADQDQAENQRDAMQLAMTIDAIDRCPKPVIAVVRGAALGAGVGLVAAADIAIAADDAVFALPEVRMGAAPSSIAPAIIAAIGPRAARRYMLTGERFDAREALRLGLLHAVVAADKLSAARDHMIDACRRGGPKAQAAVKDLIRVIGDSPSGPDLMRYTAVHMAELRATDEGREGLAAFLAKRKPGWDK